MDSSRLKALLAGKIAATLTAGQSPNQWSLQVPTERQRLFLSLEDTREAAYGGAAGGGKSSALLMDALKYVDVPGYSALLLRRTYADLSKPGALIDRAHQWLGNTSARWNETKKQWTFPSGATLSFGYMESDMDRYRYQGSEYQFCGFDELTQFTELQYTYLFSRLRRLAGTDIPIKMRSATNPGGTGARWVHERFIPDGFTPSDAEEAKVFWKSGSDSHGDVITRAFVPARLFDNPHLDREAYAESLRELDPVTREQLLQGDWQITERGDIFPMWDEKYHVISWSQFAKIYHASHIPQHWLRGVFMDCGTTEGHPNVTGWFTTAPDNAPLAGSGFLYRSVCEYGKTVREIAEGINKHKREFSSVTHWKMSHEANSERIALNRDFGLPFSSWKLDRNRGIAQARNYLEIRYKNEPYPFKADLLGRPSMYFIVNDDQLFHAVDDFGHARFRAEIPVYHYQPSASGMVIPHALFNDACLVGDTPVVSEHGNIPIRDIKIGDKVKTLKGYKLVTDWALTNPSAATEQLLISNGQTITGTLNHKIYGVDGPVQLTKFVEFDIISLCQETPNNLKKLLSLTARHIPDTQQVKTIVRDYISKVTVAVKDYMSPFGNKTTVNQFHTNATFPTQILTPSIMIHPILSASHLQNTKSYIFHPNTFGQIANAANNTLTISESRQASGINQQRAGSGIESTSLVFGKNERLEKQYVKSAESIINQDCLKNSVRVNARTETTPKNLSIKYARVARNLRQEVNPAKHFAPQSAANNSGNQDHKKTSFAPFVVLFLARWLVIGLYSVLKFAGLDTSTISTRILLPVNHAVRILLNLLGAAGCTAPLYVEKKIGSGHRPVYNITVEDEHRFFSGDIYLWNCDVLREAAADYLAPTLPLSEEEKISQKMKGIAGRTFEDILALPPMERGPAIDGWRLKEAEVRKSQDTTLIKSGIVRWRKQKARMW